MKISIKISGLNNKYGLFLAIWKIFMLRKWWNFGSYAKVSIWELCKGLGVFRSKKNDNDWNNNNLVVILVDNF
jgi:hypothetical protein